MGRTRKEILWTPQALSDLVSIQTYIGTDNPTAAVDLTARIISRIEKLKDFPLTGSVTPEMRQRGYRQVIVAPFRIFYEVQHHRVVILRVWHSKQMPEAR